MNSLYNDYLNDGGHSIAVMGIGKNNHQSIDVFLQGIILPFVKDNNSNNVWSNWKPENRDLFFFNTDGTYCRKLNLTDDYDENGIKNIIEGCLIN